MDSPEAISSKALAIGQEGNMSPALVTLKRRHQAAVRQAGVLDRRALTDAIKEFCNYVGPDGKAATQPSLAYSNITRTIYAPFGLNVKQREAIESGVMPRDSFDEGELTFIMAAERAAKTILIVGMARKWTRNLIKKRLKQKVHELAAFYRSLFDVDHLAEAA